MAEYFVVGKENIVRVASKSYKGPELFLKYTKYDYSLDIWSLGCVFASLILRKDPFFQGETNEDVLYKIVEVMGFPELKNYLEKYDITYDSDELERMRNLKCKRWNPFIQSKKSSRVTPESIDLLDSLLVMDHRCRITTRQALLHPFFCNLSFFSFDI